MFQCLLLKLVYISQPLTPSERDPLAQQRTANEAFKMKQILMSGLSASHMYEETDTNKCILLSDGMIL